LGRTRKAHFRASATSKRSRSNKRKETTAKQNTSEYTTLCLTGYSNITGLQFILGWGLILSQELVVFCSSYFPRSRLYLGAHIIPVVGCIWGLILSQGTAVFGSSFYPRGRLYLGTQLSQELVVFGASYHPKGRLYLGAHII